MSRKYFIGYLVKIVPKKRKRNKKYIGYLVPVASKRGHGHGDMYKNRDKI